MPVDVVAASVTEAGEDVIDDVAAVGLVGGVAQLVAHRGQPLVDQIHPERHLVGLDVAVGLVLGEQRRQQVLCRALGRPRPVPASLPLPGEAVGAVVDHDVVDATPLGDPSVHRTGLLDQRGS